MDKKLFEYEEVVDDNLYFENTKEDSHTGYNFSDTHESGILSNSSDGGVSKTPPDVEVVEDIEFGDITDAEKNYRLKESARQTESQVINIVDTNMSEIKTSMNEVILKQAGVLEKNAESIQCMQENITTVVKSQSELVTSISKAIDKKFSSNDEKIAGMVETKIDTVYDTIAKPLERHNRRRRIKKRNELIWRIIKFSVLGLICIMLYTNDASRERISLIVTDVKELVTGLINGEDVSSNKLVNDLGIRLNDEGADEEVK